MTTATATVLDQLIDTITSALLAKLAPLLEVRLHARLLTVRQAAVYLGRTAKAIRCLLERDAFPHVKADGRIMIDIKDLDLWIERNKT